MENSRLLISGASIAGPALAYWLARYGFALTVVEEASEVGRGGQAVEVPRRRCTTSRVGCSPPVAPRRPRSSSSRPSCSTTTATTSSSKRLWLSTPTAVAAGGFRSWSRRFRPPPSFISRYEDTFRGYAKISQRVNAGRLLAPRTRLGMRVRNSLFSVSALFTPLRKLSDHFATDIELPDYGLDQRDGSPSGR